MSEPSREQTAGPCPIDAEGLAPASRKFVAPDAPAKMKMMAAKAIIPMPPADLVQILFMLTFDADPAVRETARASAEGLSDKILTPVLRGTIPPPVLDFLAEALRGQEHHLEQILLNTAVADATFVRLARVVGGNSLTLISQNQLRLLREPQIIQAIAENPEASQAMIDSVFDFAVRSGCNLPDVPAFQEARHRILGEEAIAEAPPEETAEGLIAAHAEELAQEAAADAPAEETALDDGKRENITKMILKMSISEKIKMAMLGNKEARTILLRDPNKLVQEAVVQSPRITEGELIGMTKSRTISDTILRHILMQRDIMRVYQVKVNLVNNAKTPLATAMKLLVYLRTSDLRSLARNRNVSKTLSMQAKKLIEQKSSGG